MADVSKIKLPDNSVVNIKDYRIPGVDETPTSGSDNVVTSGGVYSNTVSAVGTSGNYLTYTKNGATNNITVPYATVAGKIGTETVGSTAKPVYINAGVPTLLGTVGTSKLPVYLNNGAITVISSFPEAYLSWGGKNFSASYGPIDAAMVDVLGACRTMFLKKEGIVIEYSTDGGETWTDYGATDVQKLNLFSTGGTLFYTGKNTTTGGGNVNNMLRVTMRTSAGGVYTSLNKFVVYVSTNGSSGCYCTIRCRTQQNYEDNVDTWVTRADQVPVNGWSGYNVINITATTTYGNAKASQYGEWQFIFGYTGYSGSSTGLGVYSIHGFGGVGWTAPSNMAKTGHLYAYDSLQNAIFPAAIYANVNDSDLGSSSKRWKLYGTSGDFNGALIVSDGATISSASEYSLTVNNTHSGQFSYIRYQKNGTTRALSGYGNGLAYISNSATYARIGVDDNGVPQYWASYNTAAADRKTLWHAGNSNLATVDWTAKDVTASKFVKSGGTSSQFLKADGSVDSNIYATTTDLEDYAALNGNISEEFGVNKLNFYSDGTGSPTTLGTWSGGKLSLNSEKQLQLSYKQTEQAIGDPTTTVNTVTKTVAYTSDLTAKENVSNKVTSLSSSSTNTQYPSAKCVYDALTTKQDTLVAGTNIKTVKGVSLLGSGNIPVLDGANMVMYLGDDGEGPDFDSSDGAWYFSTNASDYSGGELPKTGDIVIWRDYYEGDQSTSPRDNLELFRVTKEIDEEEDIQIYAEYPNDYTKFELLGATGPVGPAGITSVDVYIDNTSGTPSVSASISNQVLTLMFSGLKGATGASGYSGGQNELQVVNDLTTGGTTAALSAEMGKTLNESIPQWETMTEDAFDLLRLNHNVDSDVFYFLYEDE